jgi:predicted DNA-binding transcriptional regulator AlpA
VAAAVYRDALTAMSTEEIVSKHGISRRTMYRLLKRGGIGGG